MFPMEFVEISTEKELIRVLKYIRNNNLEKTFLSCITRNVGTLSHGILKFVYEV